MEDNNTITLLIKFSNTIYGKERKIMYFKNPEEGKEYFKDLKVKHINILAHDNTLGKVTNMNVICNDDRNYFVDYQTNNLPSYAYCTFHIELIELEDHHVADLNKFM